MEWAVERHQGFSGEVGISRLRTGRGSGARLQVRGKSAGQHKGTGGQWGINPELGRAGVG